MFTSRNFKTLLLLSATLLFFNPHAPAQSGRAPQTPRHVPGTQPAPAPTPADNTRYDRVKVVVSRGIEEFVKALNEQGQLGYRLEKTVGYGGPEPQGYAAVLHLDPGHRYDYGSDPLPKDARYGDPLDYYPRRGYGLAHAYPAVQCRQADVYDPGDPPGSPARQETQASKGNVLLFMRRDAATTQTKEYRSFTGLFAIDGGQKRELQAALDAAPPGFRPVRILFSSAGSPTFNVTILAERDLSEAAPPKVEYQLVKEVFGFEDAVNRLAAAGSRYVVGGRFESVKMALLERRAGEATAYTFIGDHKQRKEFDRTLAAGNSYAGLLGGDPTCDFYMKTVSQRLVFARGAGGDAGHEYKVLEISDRNADRKTGLLPAAAVAELQSLLAEGFRVRDLFHHYGLYAVVERETDARVSQARERGRRVPVR